jgi:hypothetical protein
MWKRSESSKPRKLTYDFAVDGFRWVILPRRTANSQMVGTKRISPSGQTFIREETAKTKTISLLYTLSLTHSSLNVFVRHRVTAPDFLLPRLLSLTA